MRQKRSVAGTGSEAAPTPPPARERIHLRVARDVKEMLEQAAAVSTGGDVKAFVIGAVAERARRVLNDPEVTLIDDESRRRFYDLVMNPPEPSAALKKLLASLR